MKKILRSISILVSLAVMSSCTGLLMDVVEDVVDNFLDTFTFTTLQRRYHSISQTPYAVGLKQCDTIAFWCGIDEWEGGETGVAGRVYEELPGSEECDFTDLVLFFRPGDIKKGKTVSLPPESVFFYYNRYRIIGRDRIQPFYDSLADIESCTVHFDSVSSKKIVGTFKIKGSVISNFTEEELFFETADGEFELSYVDPEYNAAYRKVVTKVGRCLKEERIH